MGVGLALKHAAAADRRRTKGGGEGLGDGICGEEGRAWGRTYPRKRDGAAAETVQRDGSGASNLSLAIGKRNNKRDGGMERPLCRKVGIDEETALCTKTRRLQITDHNVDSQILTPMRNAIEHIWHYFHLLDQLTYPPELLHLGLLVSDTPSDGTYARALELADERQYSRKYRGKRWGKISVFQKDFAKEQAEDEAGQGGYEGENVGAERHAYEAQVGRRKLLAKSRTWLLTSALSPEVDHVLWLDVDLVDYEPQMVERLLAYGSGDLGEGSEGADVVVPNCVWKTYNEMGLVASTSHHPLTWS